MAGRRKGGERILGPYEHGRGYRVVEVSSDGARSTVQFETEKQAQKYIDVYRAEQLANNRTVADALEDYKIYLTDKGNKAGSIDHTSWAVSKFLNGVDLLEQATPERCAERYGVLTATLAVASHRGILAQTKTFFRWVVASKYLQTSPMESLDGRGKRNYRKPQLRTSEGRKWLEVALRLADEGDVGATAALLTMVLGLRAGEVIAIRGRDLDETDAPGDTLWIDDAKTAAGRRELEVPDVLRPLLLDLAKSSGPSGPLFGKHWRDWPRHQVQRICDLAGVPKVTAHGMRGFYATRRLRRGDAPEDVVRDIGHEEIGTTTRSYAARGSLAAGTNKRAFERMLKTIPTQQRETTDDNEPGGTK